MTGMCTAAILFFEGVHVRKSKSYIKRHTPRTLFKYDE